MEQPGLFTLMEVGSLSEDGMIIIDRKTLETVYVNNKASTLIALKTDDPPYKWKWLWKNVNPADRDHVRRRYLDPQRNNLQNVEFRFSSATGEKILCCDAYLIMESAYALIILEDITNSRSHTDFLVEYGTKKNTLLDAPLAHHMNGALNVMNHLANEAQKSLSNREDVSIYLSMLKRNTNHCISIIHDLIHEENEKAPEILVKENRVDVGALSGLIISESKASYPERPIVFESVPESIFIKVDEFKLQQILNNLLSNALKFTPLNKEVRLFVTETQNQILFIVHDEGIGIPDSLRPIIFDRFTKAGRKGLNGEKSTGLGLYICKRLADLIGAIIWADSTEHIGSNFYLAFPRQD